MAHAQPPSRDVRVRIGATAGRHLVAKRARLLGRHRRLRRLRPGRGHEARLRRGRAVPHPARAGGLARDLHQPAARTGRSAATARRSRCGRRERTMDLLAERLDISPLELRRRNLLRDGDRFATGEVMHDVHFEECLQAAADAVGYEEDPRGKGLCVLFKGMQTPSRAAIAVERTPVGYVDPLAPRARWARASGESLRLQGGGAARLRARSDRAPRPGHRQFARSTRAPPPAAPRYMMGRALREAVHDLDAANDDERGFGEVANPGRARPRYRPGHRLDPLAPGRRGGAGGRGRGDRPRDGRAPARRGVRGPSGRPRGGGAAERGLDDHGPRYRAASRRSTFADGQVTNANLSDYNSRRAGDLPAPPHPRADRARRRRGARPGGDGPSPGARRDRQRAAVARPPPARSSR